MYPRRPWARGTYLSSFDTNFGCPLLYDPMHSPGGNSMITQCTFMKTVISVALISFTKWRNVRLWTRVVTALDKKSTRSEEEARARARRQDDDEQTKIAEKIAGHKRWRCLLARRTMSLKMRRKYCKAREL